MINSVFWEDGLCDVCCRLTSLIDKIRDEFGDVLWGCGSYEIHPNMRQGKRYQEYNSRLADLVNENTSPCLRVCVSQDCPCPVNDSVGGLICIDCLNDLGLYC